MLVIGLGSVNAQQEHITNYTKLEHLIGRVSATNDTVYVVNFWATWCKPCVAELPTFKSLAQELESKPYKFIFVSLDFANQLEKRLVPFVKANFNKEEVAILTDTDVNAWINQVSKDWSGAVPATAVYKNKKQLAFVESVFHSTDDLLNFIDQTNK